MSGTGYKSRKHHNPDQQIDSRFSNLTQDADTTMMVNQKQNINQQSPVNVSRQYSSGR